MIKQDYVRLSTDYGYLWIVGQSIFKNLTV